MVCIPCCLYNIFLWDFKVANIKITPAQMEVLDDISQNRKSWIGHARSIKVLERLGLISPKLDAGPLDADYELTDSGRILVTNEYEGSKNGS